MLNKNKPNKMSKRNRVSVAAMMEQQSSESSSEAFYKKLRKDNHSKKASVLEEEKNDNNPTDYKVISVKCTDNKNNSIEHLT